VREIIVSRIKNILEGPYKVVARAMLVTIFINNKTSLCLFEAIEKIDVFDTPKEKYNQLGNFLSGTSASIDNAMNDAAFKLLSFDENDPAELIKMMSIFIMDNVEGNTRIREEILNIFLEASGYIDQEMVIKDIN